MQAICILGRYMQSWKYCKLMPGSGNKGNFDEV